MPGFDRQGPPSGDGNQSGKRKGKCNPKSKRSDTSDEEWELENEKLSKIYGKRKGHGRGKGQVKRHWKSDDDLLSKD